MRVFGNIMNRISEHTTGIPEIGMGCTICMYSDRHAATVVEILSAHRILVQEDIAVRTDNNGVSDSGQEYACRPDPKAEKQMFTKRRDGTWKLHKEGTGLLLGRRDHYHDFSF